MDYLDFLDLVLAEELAVRDDRRFCQGLRLCVSNLSLTSPGEA